jgi:single-stranded-DNA-specific exonuclease
LEDKIDLLITVDCGITNVEEIKYLTENNIEIIVTDHHEPLEVIPEAYAVVNPKINNLKIKDLAGCGVVFYFCWAFLMYSAEYFERISELDWQKLLKTDYAIISFFKRYISFATLGTISDIMPLLDDNRFIVKTGLHNLRHSKIKAIDAWLEKLKCETDKLNATFVAWNVTPILNSAGRMEKPELGVSFLCAETSLEAMQILSEIEKLNNSRRKIQTRDVKTVEKILRDDENIVFVAHQSLDKNVTGIVANNVMKKYEKPVFVIAKGETQSVGSVRAPKGYDMVSWFELCSDSL